LRLAVGGCLDPSPLARLKPQAVTDRFRAARSQHRETTGRKPQDASRKPSFCLAAEWQDVVPSFPFQRSKLVSQDIRYALRTLQKNPGFAAVAIATLSLGIAATTAIFSVVNGILLRPLPYPNADRIVQVWPTTEDEPQGSFSPADFVEFQRSVRILDALAGYREDALTIAHSGADPVQVLGAHVTLDYFEVFGSAPLLGRTFSRAADAATNEPLAVLGEKVWRDTTASDPAIIGKRLRINGVTQTVVGVMPKAFDYPTGAQAWVLSSKPVPPPPLDVSGDLLESRDVHYFQAVGRVRPGATLAQAQSEAAVIADGLARQYPQTNAGRGARVERLHDRIVGDSKRALLVLLGAVGVVLLIACANVASLLLARGAGRQRELAIRTALGATRARLVRQLLAESVVLATAGGTLGLLMGTWAVDLLAAIMPEGVPRVGEIGLDARVAAVTVLTSLGSAVIFGLVPSLQASHSDGSVVMRDAGDRASTSGRGRARTRSALVVAEVALTLVLLVSAGLLANSFIRLQRIDPGFRAEQVTLVQIPLPQGKYADGKQQAMFYGQLLERLRQHGEIQLPAVAFPSPLSGANASASFLIEGRPPATRADRPRAGLASISPEYLRTIGIPLMAGRHFTDRDREPNPAVIIVNAAFARRHFPGQDPLGKRIRFDDTKDEWLSIVGVAGDARDRGLDAAPEPVLYIPYQYLTLPFMSVVARSAGGTGAVASAVRAEVRSLDPDLPVDEVRPLSDIVRDSVAQPRFRMLVLGTFALTALLLAAVGVYGLISYSVAQRTREIGIRVALGARPAQVTLPIVREGLALTAMGVAIGLAGSVAVTRLLATFLFGIDATDPLTFFAVAALLLGVTFAASYVPSRRALRVDPLTALRAE
jgi:predicted permease